MLHQAAKPCKFLLSTWYATVNSKRKEVFSRMKQDWIILVGVLLLAAHMVIIINDVQAVIYDPNTDNKPAEVVKLIVDLSRYWPK